MDNIESQRIRKEIDGLVEDMAAAQAKMNQCLGNEEALLKELQQFGITDVEQAEIRIKELTEEVQTLKNELDAIINEVKTQLGTVLKP